MLHSNAGQDIGIKNPVHSTSLQQGGIKQPLHSNTEQDIPSNDMLYPNTPSGYPANQSFPLPWQEGMPPKQEFHTEGAQGGASNNPLYPASGKAMPANEPLPLLPETIMPSAENVSLLFTKLRQSMLKRSGHSAQRSGAKLLIHFHNKGTGKYSDLQQLTGYSPGGLAKLMMLLRRKGLIKRSAFQQFALSPAALQLMHEAGLK